MSLQSKLFPEIPCCMLLQLPQPEHQNLRRQNCQGSLLKSPVKSSTTLLRTSNPWYGMKTNRLSKRVLILLLTAGFLLVAAPRRTFCQDDESSRQIVLDRF